MTLNIRKMHRLYLLLIIIVSFSFSSCKEKETSPPNIVWLIAEDLSPDVGCYGNNDISTPNIDKLTINGTKYENAFASGSVCSPSRSAFITGLYQTSIGSNFHRTMKRNMYRLPESIKTLPQYFYDAGYFVDYNGKFDLNFKSSDAALKNRKLEERNPEQPAFIILQTYHTHRPFHKHKNTVNPNKVSIPGYYPDHSITRQDWANYLEDVLHCDDWVGEQMKWLEDNDLLNNTIVVFFGDHGRPHVRDKQFLYDGSLKVPLVIKWFGKNEETQVIDDVVSLVDLAPTMLKAANLEVPSHMHGIDIRQEIDREFVVGARDRNGDAIDKMRCLRTKDYLFIKNFMPEIAYMQKSGYKLTNYPVYTLMKEMHKEGKLTPEQARFMKEEKPVYELYDVRSDPEQLYNIADQNPELVAEFDKKLTEWQKITNDTFPDPDLKNLPKKMRGKQEWLNGWFEKNDLPVGASDEELLEFWTNQLFKQDTVTQKED